MAFCPTQVDQRLSIMSPCRIRFRWKIRPWSRITIPCLSSSTPLLVDFGMYKLRGVSGEPYDSNNDGLSIFSHSETDHNSSHIHLHISWTSGHPPKSNFSTRCRWLAVTGTTEINSLGLHWFVKPPMLVGPLVTGKFVPQSSTWRRWALTGVRMS